MKQHWYVFRVKPQQENDARAALRKAFGAPDDSVWLAAWPVLKLKNRHAKAKVIVRNPIHGYVFMKHYTVPPYYMVSGHKAFLGLMMMGEKPVRILDYEMELFRLAIDDEEARLTNGNRPRTPHEVGARIQDEFGRVGTVMEQLSGEKARVIFEAVMLGKSEATVSYDKMRAA